MQVLIKIMSILLGFIYGAVKIFTPTKNKITMISRQSNTPSLDFQLLEQDILSQAYKPQLAVLCRKLEGNLASALSYGFHMLKQMYHIATSKVVILDSYCILISLLKHKKSLKVVQIWHSMGSMKEFGYKSLDKSDGSSSKLARAMKMHRNYDFVLISAEAYKEDMSVSFKCDINKILIKPLPRLDLLNSHTYSAETRSKIFAQYPDLQNKKNILYCPTFRKDEQQMQKSVDQLIDAIDYTENNLIVKLHPLSTTRVKQHSSVFSPADFTTFDMLFVSDYVISDYSCVVYEAGILNIPLYFYSFDIDLYKDNRGLAIDYEAECPGIITKNPNEIMRSIQSGQYDFDYLKSFIQKYVHPTPHATKDIVDFINTLMEK